MARISLLAQPLHVLHTLYAKCHGVSYVTWPSLAVVCLEHVVAENEFKMATGARHPSILSCSLMASWVGAQLLVVALAAGWPNGGMSAGWYQTVSETYT